jgi:hypothetical protein
MTVERSRIRLLLGAAALLAAPVASARATAPGITVYKSPT